jgi:hypothetical protein
VAHSKLSTLHEAHKQRFEISLLQLKHTVRAFSPRPSLLGENVPQLQQNSQNSVFGKPEERAWAVISQSILAFSSTSKEASWMGQ